MQAPPLRLFPHSFAKVRLSEQNTKQKGKFFHFCLYFRAKVPSTDRSKLRIIFYSAKKIAIFFKKKFFAFYPHLSLYMAASSINTGLKLSEGYF